MSSLKVITVLLVALGLVGLFYCGVKFRTRGASVVIGPVPEATPQSQLNEKPQVRALPRVRHYYATR